MNYDCLLSILQELGVKGTVLQWFKAYLLNREQRINIKGTCSDSKELATGVPQGSVLGPVLFNVYTSSLGRLLRKHLPQYHFYADDSNLYVCVKPSALTGATKQLEECVAAIQSWMCSHQLQMNEEKTEFIIINTKQAATKITPLPLTIGDNVIEPSPTAGSLGVLWDSNASMEAHINNICRAAFLQLHNIGKLQRYMDLSSLEAIVHAFITTRLDYCNSLLCGLPASLLNRL